MRENQHKSWSHQTASAPEQVLELYYGKLRKWGVILTRGDTGMAQEIVHDLCLYFTVVKPDLSQVENLDGYLYTSLRHIYLSALARSSREAVQFVDVADFDSIQFALNPSTTDDLLERQNELRRICSYSVWRKDSSKSASYFILHFFHGYARREIAEIACLPIAAIYNKLKAARTEVKSHLEASGKLRIALREAPPEPELLLSPISSTELFDNLQQTIFDAKDSECLSEETLVKYYQIARPGPIPCGLLSHIVSCKRCLDAIDRHFQRPTWEDREPPAGVWSSLDRKDTNSAALDTKSYKALMRAVQWQRDRVHDHRPRTLSIAVNGKIAAFHDVQSEHSTLAARIEHLEAAQFIEVFTDQQIRLAMLPIDERPPEGPHVHTQRVTLSDDRWLELVLSFDGQGLHSEVTYFDPTLAAQIVEEEVDEELPSVEAPRNTALLAAPSIEPKADSICARIARSFARMTPRCALAWAMMIVAVLSGAGYFAYRYGHSSLDARAVLNDSVRIEAASMKGQAEHQVLRLETLGSDGRAVWQGTVDVWQEHASRRFMRRLYDAQHRLVAAEWSEKNGESGSFEAPAGSAMSEADRRVAESAFWKLDISAHEFQTMAAQLKIRNAGDDYELTGSDLWSAPPHLVSATLVLDHRLRVVSETLRINGGYGFTAVRFVEASDEHLPTASVPESVFNPTDLESQMNGNSGSTFAQRGVGDYLGGTPARLVQTEVAALYRLSELGADVGEPIEIVRTPGGQIRIAGTVASEARKIQIVTALQNMPDHQLLQVDLATQGSIRVPIPSSHLAVPATSVYNVAHTAPPAEPLLRGYFVAKGLTGNQIDAAVTHFSTEAIDHAQRALQNAYALDRLGASFSPNELRAMGPIAQQQWSEMVAQHATALETELDELQRQLAQLATEPSPLSSPRQSSSIDTPQDFAGAARRLLFEMQDLNREVGMAFSAGTSGRSTRTAESSIDAVRESIPFNELEQLTAFASRLADAKDAANRSVKQYPRLSR